MLGLQPSFSVISSNLPNVVVWGRNGCFCHRQLESDRKPSCTIRALRMRQRLISLGAKVRYLLIESLTIFPKMVLTISKMPSPSFGRYSRALLEIVLAAGVLLSLLQEHDATTSYSSRELADVCSNLPFTQVHGAGTSLAQSASRNSKTMVLHWCIAHFLLDPSYAARFE